MFDETKLHEFRSSVGEIVTARRLTEPDKIDTIDGPVLATVGSWRVDTKYGVRVVSHEDFEVEFLPLVSAD